MMTYAELMTALHILRDAGDCAMYEFCGVMCVDFIDFVGFTEDWDEEYREYERPELVEEIEEFLDAYAEGDFYKHLTLEDHELQFGYTSFNI